MHGHPRGTPTCRIVRESNALSGSLFVPFGLLLVALVTALASILYLSADRHNQIVRTGSQRVAMGAIETMAEYLEKSVMDYAFWNDTVKNVIEDFDSQWADDNIGNWTFQNLSIDAALVFDSAERPLYGAIRGKSLPPMAVLKTLGQDALVPLIESVRAAPGKPGERSATPSAFLLVDGVPHLAAVAAIKFEKAVVGRPDPGPQGFLVFTQELSAQKLEELERRLQFENLRFSPAKTSDDRATLALRTGDNRIIGMLAWDVEQPGTEMLVNLSIPLAITFAVTGFLAVLIVLRIRRAARTLELNHLELATQRNALASAYESVEIQRRIEADLREKATEANRAKSLFLAHMSHEFRTPLNAIIGFSEFVLINPNNVLKEAKTREYVADIHQSGRQLLSLINDVLDLAKIESGKREMHDEELDLDALVLECIRVLKPQISRKLLEVQNVPSRIALIVDGRSMRQILTNLLSNAVKFTNQGGRITIATEHQVDGFAITVTDTGCGIAPTDIEKVLQPFGQVDTAVNRTTSGTGLGLSIVQKLIEMHGGNLKIDSEPGRGTRVTVVLPSSRTLSVRSGTPSVFA